jgi:ATPase subunit of ABC transporter with duplicated ATPase domains
MVADLERQPQILTPRERSVDAYRHVIERYDVATLRPVDPLKDRERVIATLVDQLRPLLDAIVEVEAAEAEVARLSRTLEEHQGAVAQVAAGRLIRARERRSLASQTVKELVRGEQTILRFALLRQLVRSTPLAPRR